MAEITIQLEKDVFPPGGRVAGMVTLATNRPMPVRGVRIRLEGRTASAQAPARSLVSEEFTMTGREKFGSAIEGILDCWGVILGRRAHPRLQPGEYAYPFVFDLPPDAPPSGRIEQDETTYTLTAYADLPLARDPSAQVEIRVAAE